MTNEKQNEVSENKEIPHEINSVSDLSQILQTLGEPEKGHTRFFRGHGDEDWKLLPSIYRETYLIENEDKHKPHSDEALAQLLKRQGIDIARRTVAKYRESLNIAPAHQRRI